MEGSVLFLIIALIGGYLCGSIPFGLLITKLAGTEDIRAIGSGNIGATNVLRTGRKSLAAMTLLGDALKGTIPVLIAATFSDMAAYVTAFGAFIGHLFPVWLKFRGGKGIATLVGLLLAFWWQGFAAFALIWLTTAFLFKYSSLAALAATLAAPLAFWLADRPGPALLFAILAAIAWFMHRANINRLLSGTEPRIGSKD